MTTKPHANCIDGHAHLAPLSFLNVVQGAAKSFGVKVERTADGHAVDFPNMPKLRPAGGRLVDLDSRGEWMESQGVTHQVTGPWLDVVGYTLPARKEVEWVRLLNEHMAADVSASGDQFRALAAVPLRSGDAAAKELEWAVEKAGMVGAMVPSDPVDVDVASPSLESFWATAAKLGVPVLLHGASHSKWDFFGPSYLAYSMGRTFDTTVLAAKLILSGVLDRHPNLKLVLCHGGGALPYMIGRVEDGYQRGIEKRADLALGGPEAYLPMMYYDTVTLNERSLRMLKDYVGAGHIMLGSDWVWGPMAQEFAGPVERVVEGAELDSIRRGTAEELFGIAESV
ncbi:MAG: amidohydrolase family protein [Chloroflexi bacterium]|nr:amidohydrolase family protein [Chloroflexota bacterium]